MIEKETELTADDGLLRHHPMNTEIINNATNRDLEAAVITGGDVPTIAVPASLYVLSRAGSDDVVLRFGAGLSISGTVFGPDGKGAAGTWISVFLSGGPASSSRTRRDGSAERRWARTQPAEPAPTMIVS